MGRSNTRQGVACDHAERPDSPRIHCRGTQKHEGLTSIRLVGRPPSQKCATSGMEPAVLHAPGLRAGAGSSASNLREPRCETVTMGFTSAAHGCITQPLHPCDPAAFRGSCRRYMSGTLGNQTPAEPVSSGSWAKPLLNCPTRGSTAISQTGCGRNTRIASIAVNPTTGPLMPVQYGGAGPKASPSNSSWHMTLPPLPVSRQGCPRRLVPNNTTTPPESTTSAGPEQSQAVCKLRNSSNFISIL